MSMQVASVIHFAYSCCCTLLCYINYTMRVPPGLRSGDRHGMVTVKKLSMAWNLNNDASRLEPRDLDENDIQVLHQELWQ